MRILAGSLALMLLGLFLFLHIEFIRYNIFRWSFAIFHEPIQKWSSSKTAVAVSSPCLTWSRATVCMTVRSAIVRDPRSLSANCCSRFGRFTIYNFVFPILSAIFGVPNTIGFIRFITKFCSIFLLKIPLFRCPRKKALPYSSASWRIIGSVSFTSRRWPSSVSACSSWSTLCRWGVRSFLLSLEFWTYSLISCENG